MVDLPGFINLEQIFISNGYSVFRGQREGDKSKVLLKVLDAGRVTIEVLKQFNNEYKRVCDFDFDGVVKPSSLEDCGDYKIIVFEDHDYKFLNEVIDQQVFELDEALVIANNMIIAIGELHSWQIIHRKICPSDILINLESKKITLFGAGIFDASHFWNRSEEYKRHFLYLSPEVKLLTNYRSDYRSDYFSFGVILFQMLCGYLPFNNDSCFGDSEQQISFSPAKVGQPTSVAPVPNVIADIVRKLLSIDPVDRYQSVWGINADLEQCVDQLRARGKIYHFPLARHDVSSQFAIPEKLYGREVEMRQLLESYSRVSKGTKEIAAIYGDAGSGKTAIVNEVKNTVERRNGTFISGNFESDYSDIPNGALVAALKEFVASVILPDKAKRDYWSDLVLDIAGDNGQVLIDLIPDLELVIGPQAEVDKLGYPESKNRFEYLLQSLVLCFSNAKKPLVLFLDNFHLADKSTITFLMDMLANSTTNYLMVIFAYRKEDAGANNNPNVLLQQLQRSGVKVKELHLNRLLLQHISQLVVDALYSDKTEVNALAKLIEKKTNGNPLFVDEFLKTLFAEQMIYFDSNQGKWQWDLKEIQSRDSFDNVVDFIAGRIARMGEQVQRLLTVAATIGNKFDVNLLAKILDKPVSDVAAALNELVLAGIIFESDGARINVGGETNLQGVAVNYRFSHGIVRHSISTLLSPTVLSKLHNDIGVALLENETDDSITFEITDQLNSGAVISELNEEKCGKLIYLNMRAAERALAINAYLFAYRYLSFAIKVIGINGWSKSYDLMVKLHIDLLRCSYLNDDYSSMATIFEQTIAKVSTPIDRAKVYETVMDGCLKVKDDEKAIKYYLIALKELGFEFKEKPNKLKMYFDFFKIRRQLARKDLSFIEDLPQMTDESIKTALRIGIKGSLSLFLTKPEVYAAVVLKGTYLTLKYGLSDDAPIIIAGLATFYSVNFGDVEQGYQLSKLATVLAKNTGKKEIESKVKFITSFFVLRFKGHLNGAVTPLLESYKECIGYGEFEYASLAMLAACMTQFHISTDLKSMREMMQQNLTDIKRLGMDTHIVVIQMVSQLIVNISEPNENFVHISGEIFNEDVQKPVLVMSGDRARLFYFHCFKMILNYNNDDYFAALAEVSEGENYLEFVTGFYETVLFGLYDTLTRLAVYNDPRVSRSEQKLIINKVKKFQNKLDNWVKHSPENNQHKFYLVEAELNRVLGNALKAISLYGKAIELAKKHGYINEEALINEIAGRFYLQTGKSRMAEVHMQEAHTLYKKWGCYAFSTKLEKKYPELINSEVFGFANH